MSHIEYSVTLMNDRQDAAFRAMDARNWSEASDHFARVWSIARALTPKAPRFAARAESAARLAHKMAITAEIISLRFAVPVLPPARACACA